jgi:hypothetical protein
VFCYPEYGLQGATERLVIEQAAIDDIARRRKRFIVRILQVLADAAFGA